MIDASDRGRPAVEAIAQRLYDQFGEEIQRDRLKQFVGALIRQVMERNGFEHVERSKPTRGTSLFTHGSVYRRRS